MEEAGSADQDVLLMKVDGSLLVSVFNTDLASHL